MEDIWGRDIQNWSNSVWIRRSLTVDKNPDELVLISACSARLKYMRWQIFGSSQNGIVMSKHFRGKRIVDLLASSFLVILVMLVMICLLLCMIDAIKYSLIIHSYTIIAYHKKTGDKTLAHLFPVAGAPWTGRPIGTSCWELTCNRRRIIRYLIVIQKHTPQFLSCFDCLGERSIFRSVRESQLRQYAIFAERPSIMGCFLYGTGIDV